jgi:hypothetical protein
MFKPRHIPRTATLAATLILSAPGAEAGIVNYTFSGTVDFGSLLGESYSGTASFDDAGLTGTGDESLPVSALTFSFHNGSFNQASGTASPTADFLDGTFLGLSFEVTAFDPDFSFISGSLDSSDAYFGYTPDNINNDPGYGSLVYNLVIPGSVPVPGTLALLGIGLAGLAGTRRRLQA